MSAIKDRFDNLAAQLDFNRLSRSQTQAAEADKQSDKEPQRHLGSSFSVSLRLDSGAEVEFSVRQSLSGRLSDFSLLTSQPLTDKEKEIFAAIVDGLADAIDTLFSGEANGRTDLFQSLSGAPIDDLEVSASHQAGVLAQELTLEQEEWRSGETRLTADWQQRDLDAGINDRHGFELSKKPGALAEAYGQVDTNWLEQKLAAATSVLGTTRNLAGGLQSNALSSFYGSALNALLQVANDGSRALQDLGASADQARSFVGRTVEALSAKALAEGGGGGILAMPDFDGTFTSNRQQGLRETGPGTYQFDLNLSQRSRRSYDEARDVHNLSQRRELDLSYRTATEEQSLSLSWGSEERQRYMLSDGQVDTSGWRRLDALQWVIEDARGRSSGYQQLIERNNEDFRLKDKPPSTMTLDGSEYRGVKERLNYYV